MKELLAQLQSKKLRVLIVTCIGALISAYTGAVTWPEALSGMLAAAGVYMGAQGISDGLSGGMTSSIPGTPTASDLPKNE